MRSSGDRNCEILKECLYYCYLHLSSQLGGILKWETWNSRWFYKFTRSDVHILPFVIIYFLYYSPTFIWLILINLIWYSARFLDEVSIGISNRSYRSSKKYPVIYTRYLSGIYNLPISTWIQHSFNRIDVWSHKLHLRDTLMDLWIHQLVTAGGRRHVP